MIHLVTALVAEAEPLAVALDLRRRPSTRSGFDLWEGDEARLVVSGVGRVASAAATAYLAVLGQGPAPVWLNVGVAAHRQLEIGAAIVAHKLVEAATGRSWFPQLIAEPTLPTATVCTVDRPIESPRDDRVYEMEATGFFDTARRWASAEVIGCVKVISDHGVGKEAIPRRLEISELISARAAEVLAYGRAMEAMLAEHAPPIETEDVSAVLERWHFTVTQERTLRALARRAAALSTSVATLIPRQAATSRQLLAVLEARLDELALAEV